MDSIANLIDRLTIQQLKLLHKNEEEKEDIDFLNQQIERLKNEIDDFFLNAITGKIPIEHIRIPQCKVYRQEFYKEIDYDSKSLAELIVELAMANLRMWDNQSMFYNWDDLPDEKTKDEIAKKVGTLNLDRVNLIDAIDQRFYEMLKNKESI